MDEKIDYNKLNQAVYDFIYGDYEECKDYYRLEDVVELERIVDIILKYDLAIDDVSYKNRYSKDKCFDNSYELFKRINPEYAFLFNEIRNRKDIYIDKSEIEEPFTGFNFVTNKKEIFIPWSNIVQDCYSLSHEFMHYANMKEENIDSITYDLFTEMFSFTIELLQRDYFDIKKEQSRDYKRVYINIFTTIGQMALRLKYEIHLIKEVLTRGYIDKMTILEMVSNYEDIDELKDVVKEIEDKQDFKYFDYQNYIYGAIIGSYIHQRIVDNPKYIKQFFELNECFYNLSIKQVFEYIGISYDKEIADEEFEKLEKCYKKELNRMW